MDLVERRRELAELKRLLDRAGAGSGDVLVVAGPPGSGRTALVDVAAATARERGFEVLRGTPAGGTPGRRVWAQLVRDAGGPDELAARLLDEPEFSDLDAAAVALCSKSRRLIVVDDVDLGGPDAVALLVLLAGRVAGRPVALVATSGTPLGIGNEVWLGPLSPAGIGGVTGETRPDVRHALWVASRGLPGPARALAATVETGGGGDPVVALALATASREGFLEVDTGLVGLLETALPRACDDATRARLEARLAHGLLGDTGQWPGAAISSRRPSYWPPPQR